jgi:hypothetical protein
MSQGKEVLIFGETSNLGRTVLSGAISGTISALVFTAIHHIFISDIWFSLILMLAAGALCGLCVSWSYRLLVERPSAVSWLGYNLLYVGMLVLLGAASVIVFEPVTTIAALIGSNGPPDALIGQALPMTAAFTLAAAGLVSLVYRRDWAGFAASLVTCTVLVVLLGLNVSIIGLVAIPRSSLYLILEMFGLIVALNGVYLVAFIALERKSLVKVTPAKRRSRIVT